MKKLKEDKRMKIYRDMRQKKIKVGNKLNYIPDNVGVEMDISLDDEGFLHFPVLILYDEYQTTDFI